jgi:hypothetical protein
VKRTPRGFAIYDEFTDTCGAEVHVVQSSAATVDATWVFVRGGSITGNEGSMHLDREGIKRLRKALKAALR